MAIPCLHGASALATIETSRPDVVLLDIQLDTADRGWEILETLRQRNGGGGCQLLSAPEHPASQRGLTVSFATEWRRYASRTCLMIC